MIFDSSRGAAVLITLAPVVVLTAVSLPILVLVESPFGAAIVVTTLVTNVAGIGSDLGTVLVLRRLPPGTLLYYSDEAQLPYEPDVPAQ